VIGLILVAFVHLIYLADYAFRYLGKGLIAWDAPAWFGVFPVMSLVLLLSSVLLLVLRRLPGRRVLRTGGLAAAWVMWLVGSSLLAGIEPPVYLG
jgi:hypothetical protein